MSKRKKEQNSIFRSINRRVIKEQVKEHNIGIAKKYRMKVSDVWNYYQDRKYGKDKHTAILINNAPNKKGAKRKIYEERVDQYGKFKK